MFENNTSTIYRSFGNSVYGGIPANSSNFRRSVWGLDINGRYEKPAACCVRTGPAPFDTMVLGAPDSLRNFPNSIFNHPGTTDNLIKKMSYGEDCC